MGTIIQILNAGMQHPPQRRRRLWVEIGVGLVVGSRLVAHVHVDRQGDELVPAIRLQAPQFDETFIVPAACYLDMTAWSGMLAIPRALECDPPWRPRRVLMEFVAVRDDVRWAV